MQHLTTFIVLFVSISLGIYPAASADQSVLSAVPMEFERPFNHLPTLFDLLTIEPTTSIFFSYARELELSRLLVDLNSNVTVLVPTNKAVMALAKKPHQDSDIDDSIKLTEQELEERSNKKVERWVSCHMIPGSPILLASRTYRTLAEGKTIAFVGTGKDTTLPEWERVLINGDIRIINAKEAINGVLYVIDGTISDD